MSTHLSFDDRKFIETNLFDGLSISFIAKQLNYSYSTISNEIKKCSVIQPNSVFIYERIKPLTLVPYI